jgi:putative ABC transport system permease protein
VDLIYHRLMILADFRYASRVLRKTPLLTLAILFTMTLGIGGATAIFSVVNAVMLRPLPFADPDRLMWVAERNDTMHLPTFSASVLNYLSWKDQTRTFEQLGAIGFTTVNLTGGDREPEQLAANSITPSVFPILGVSLVAGRAFREDESRVGAPRVAMISEGLWRRRFAASEVVGTRVLLNGESVEIVGVAPESVRILMPSDVWVPLAVDQPNQNRLNHLVVAIGRIASGVSMARAQQEMDEIAARDGRQYPEVKDWGIRLVSFDHWIVGDSLRTSLWVLFGAVGCVLLIACANVANLLLSRAVAREQEMATRMALGAGRRRLVRQLLVESLLLAGIGGALGLGAATWGVHVVNARLPQGVLPIPSIGIDIPVLLFALAATAGTGLLFGLAPAWTLARPDLSMVLKSASRGTTASRHWTRRGLAAAEIAMATMLLVGASLLGQTLVRLQHVDLGFRPDHLLTFQLSPPRSKYTLDAKAPILYTQLLESLAALPGVRGAALSSGVPFGNGNYTTTPMKAVGQSVLPPDTSVPIDWRIVSPGFFQAMGIPVRRGRTFMSGDGPGIMVVSDATARRFFGDADPVGRLLHRVGDGADLTIIGVVGDVKNAALNTDTPAMYYPATVRVWPRMDLIVRTAGDPASVLAGVRQVVRAQDPDLPISTVRTMDEWLSAGAAQPRLNAMLLSVFSFVALVIAAVGIYGILAYSVNRRIREIGVRLALGAPRGRVLALVLGEGLGVGLAGIGAGIAGSLALGRLLNTLVYGVPVRDPLTIAIVTGTLAVVVLAACALPARRASRVDPIIALRAE